MTHSVESDGVEQRPIAPDLWPAIVDLARWAPSVHNTQAWKVRPTSSNEAELRYDPKRLLALTDRDGRFWTIGMGVFVSCLEVAASALGCSVTVDFPGTRLNAAADGSQYFASLRLGTSSKPNPLPAALLRERRTSRLPYDGRRVSPDVALELKALVAAEGQRAEFLSDPQAVAWVNGLNIETLFYDLRYRPAREEIGGWIRRSDREALERGDGFAPRCLGFNGRLLRLFFRHHWAFDRPLARDAIRWSYSRSYRGTATVGWIAGAQATPDDWFTAGRALGKLWLTAASHGLVIHPYGSVITNPTAHARLVERIRSEDEGQQTWLLFRIGYSVTAPRSARIPLSEILE